MEENKYEPKNYNEGLKIGPYPDNSYIIVNLDGSLFIETINNGEIWWTPLETKGEWLVKSDKTFRGKPTPKYITVKYRRMLDTAIGYLGVATLRLHTMYGNNETLMNLSLSDGSEVKYINGKYY